MIAKLIVYGTTRERCIMRRLRRALEEFVIEGMKTTIPLHQKLVDDPEFQARQLYDQMAGGVAGARSGIEEVLPAGAADSRPKRTGRPSIR